MKKDLRGYSLVELLVALLIGVILTLVAYSAYGAYVEKARVSAAIANIGEIQIAVAKFLVNENRGYPANLGELGLEHLRDPWGNPYQYLVIEGLGNNSAVRKDEALAPINSDFDVYSLGKDGDSESLLTSSLGRDDIVRGANGRYLGLADGY